ncbi:SWIM zinc finger family protein [Hymenobacter cellulosivorans]|uniref:SWIM-type domain-containing protein n=1 Tax=Hymenobacter cellulosivorans TaxID=2932249 RepID=A0ABY4F4X7_9BACT|nr:hypothetical protein [Hymenobacter cellulosivorans]UOQ51713.1 hypothetical protein MUN80_18350 [Hymenobacter cellulosivorans]
MVWTEEQVRALVPDAGTLKRGLELARPAPWQNLGQTPTAVWGECAGSGARPYQTAIDLSEPAFKCSCPSRVFPCKHGVGLLLLVVRSPQLFGPLAEPEWLTEWLSKRQTRRPQPREESAPPTVEPDDTARQKRESQRLERMQRGVQELEVWLIDVVRNGLARVDRAPDSFWEQQAARLVDAQLPGLAAVVRGLAALRFTGLTWPETMLARLGELYGLLQAFQRLAQLPATAQQEVLQLLGVTLKKDEILAQQPAVADTWLVVGQYRWQEERLTARRTWLWGVQTRRYALLLEYAFGEQPFATTLVPNGRYEGSLTFYPGLQPLRAVGGPLVYAGAGPRAAPADAALTPNQLLAQYAAVLRQNPWVREWPAVLRDLLPVRLADETWALEHSPTRQQLALLGADGWQLLAAGGGRPMSFFGEWNGQDFRVLSYFPGPPTS